MGCRVTPISLFYASRKEKSQKFDLVHKKVKIYYLQIRNIHNKAVFNPPGTKGFGTHTKHQGEGRKGPPPPPSISRTRNATNLKPLEGLGVSFKVSKNFKLV